MSRKTIALIVFALFAVVILASCTLTLGGSKTEERYEVVGTWRRTAGEFDSTITYYLKADGTYSYSNNQNGDLDSGEYTVDWVNNVIKTNHKMNHSLDQSLPFRFTSENDLFIGDFLYKRIK